MLASEIGDLEVIKCFVEHGANLDYAPSGREADELNITGQTALFMATLKEQNDVVQYLIERGSRVNVKNRYIIELFGLNCLMINKTKNDLYNYQNNIKLILF